jgi:hypothetical protein
MTELRNLRKLHSAQKIRIQKLESQVRFLKQENKELRAHNTILTNTVSDIQLQMEELRSIVFGKKRRDTRDDCDDVPPPPKIPRTRDSYHRPLPTETDITEKKTYHCHKRRLSLNILWSEDIAPVARNGALVPNFHTHA